MQRVGGRAVVRQGRLIAVVASFLIGCTVLLMVVGGSGVQAEATEEQGDSDRCEGTRTISRGGAGYLTNDLPGCPNKGGLLSAQLPDTGRNKISDPKYGLLRGEKGDDEIRGSSTSNCRGYPCPAGDEIYGGVGSDVIYGGSGWDWIVGDNGDDVIHAGDGNDVFLSGGKGDDVIYGGDGNDEVGSDQGEDVLYGGDGDDHLDALDLPKDGGRDKLYCGEGWDKYSADTNDYVSGSCEENLLADTSGPPLILLAGAALLLGSGVLIYAFLRRR